MCGIAGIVDFSGQPVDLRLVHRMCEELRHRGPDDRHVVASAVPGRAAAAIGVQRLSVIDVEGGRQPIANETRTVWAACNGEIYNFLELRDRLEACGHLFATRSDTEVIVHAYEEYGDAFVERIDGMFALAVWDERQGRIVLARDRFGKKPLLYADMRSRLTFASEFRALLCDPAVSRDVDPEGLGDYLALMAIPAPRTIYKSVRKLPPGHLLVRDRSGTTLRPYWVLRFLPKLDVTEDEAIIRIRELLERAVRRRLVADVPIGAFLSGGVDSSAVVGLMARASGSPVKTFSVGFDEQVYNELPHARRLAERFGCDHHELVVRPNAVDVLPALIDHFGEPFADSSAIPTHYVAAFARQHVTVALNGDGGDEVFAGYGRHLANRLAETWQRVPDPVRKVTSGVARLASPLRSDGSQPVSRFSRFIQAAMLSRAARYRAWAGVFSPEALRGLSDSSMNNDVVEAAFRNAAALDPVDAVLAVDTGLYLPTDLLVKMDITTMMHSLEARSPFLDRELVEFVARLPSSFKLRRLTTKYILKRALDGLLPSETLSRPKRGFSIPLAQWFRGELREFLADHLLASRISSQGLVRQRAVEELVAAHSSGRADHAHRLWTLLVLELWSRKSPSAVAA